MLRMKKLIGLLLIVSCLTNGLSSCKNTAEIDEITYINDSVIIVDEQRIVKASEVIISGEVVCTEVKTYYASERKDTEEVLVATVKIHECFKGDYQEGDEIITGEVGDGKTIVKSNIIKSGGYLEKGDKVVLFLERDQDDVELFNILHENEVMPYLHSSLQGRIWLDDSYEVDKIKNNYEFALFRECKTTNELKLQIAEIMSAQSNNAISE